MLGWYLANMHLPDPSYVTFISSVLTFGTALIQYLRSRSKKKSKSTYAVFKKTDFAISRLWRAATALKKWRIVYRLGTLHVASSVRTLFKKHQEIALCLHCFQKKPLDNHFGPLLMFKVYI